MLFAIATNNYGHQAITQDRFFFFLVLKRLSSTIKTTDEIIAAGIKEEAQIANPVYSPLPQPG